MSPTNSNQKRINLARVKDIARALPSTQSAQDLFNLSLGRLTAPDSVEVTQIGDGIYSFCSPRPYADLRPLQMGILSEVLQLDVPAPGNVLSVLGLAIGTPVNVMSAFDVCGRLLLRNGAHRAYALRRQGVTHAPCLLTILKDAEELELVGAPEMVRNRQHYLRSGRPPLLKDDLDDRLRTLIRVVPYTRRWQVSISIHESRVPCLRAHHPDSVTGL